MKASVIFTFVVIAGASQNIFAQDCTEVLKYAQMERSETSSHYVFHSGSYKYADSNDSNLTLDIPGLGQLGFSGASAVAITNATVDLTDDRRTSFYRDLSSQATAIYKACVDTKEIGLRYYAEISGADPDAFTLTVDYSPPFQGGIFKDMLNKSISATPQFSNADCKNLEGQPVKSGQVLTVKPNAPTQLRCARSKWGDAKVQVSSADWTASPPFKQGVTIPAIDDTPRVAVRHDPYHVYTSSVGNGYQLVDDAHAGEALKNGPRFTFLVAGPAGYKVDKLNFWVSHADPKKRPNEFLKKDEAPPSGQIQDRKTYTAGDTLHVSISGHVGKRTLQNADADVYTVPPEYTPPNFKIMKAEWSVKVQEEASRRLGSPQ